MHNYWFTNYRAQQGGTLRLRYSLTSGRPLNRETLARFLLLTLFTILASPIQAVTFSTSPEIDIPAFGSAAPYPSSILVSGVNGLVNSLNVTIKDLSHTFPDDLDILLVAPGGEKVLLMSDAGGGNDVNNVTLVFGFFTEFDPTLPDAEQIVSGRFRPSDFTGSSDSFPAPAPGGPYLTSWPTFSQVNGVWRLYVVDNSGDDAGVLAGGWEISVRGANSSFFNSSSVNVPSAGPTTPYPSPITVSGLSGELTSVIVSLQGLSHTYPDDLDVLLVGPGGQKTLVMSDVGGTLDIGLVSLIFGDERADSFLPNEGQIVTGSYLLSNVDQADTFPSPAPAGPYGTSVSVFDGRSPNGVWNLYVVDDTSGDSGSIASGWSLTFPTVANTRGIGIPDSGTATPYPSPISVAGLAGPVGSVSVTLSNLSHTFPDDLDILLVGPSGQSVILMADSGGGDKLASVDLTFRDDAAGALPDTGQINTGNYQPSNGPGTDPFASPAPAGPYGTSLSVFNGTSPNGVWNLYVVDDSSGDFGYMAEGWVLEITLASPPLISCPSHLAVQCLTDVPTCPNNLEAFLESGGTASASCGLNLSYSCSDGPLLDGVCGGTITRTHTVTDDCNNSTSCQQIIMVNDSIAPTITCPANLTVQCLSDVPPCPANRTQFLEAGGSASDNCDTDLSYSCSDGPLVGGVCGGTITRTHTVTDDCNNSTSCQQIITVSDSIAPSITCPADLTFQCISDVPPCPTELEQFLAEGGAASDICDTDLTYSCSDGPLVDGPCGGIITRTHIVTDDCNNSVSCQQIFTVNDTIAPAITCPADLTVRCIGEAEEAATGGKGLEDSFSGLGFGGSGAVMIDSYAPSVGWAGTNLNNGTLVKIRGSGFDAVPNQNRVRFTDSSGSQTVMAYVEWAVAEGLNYKFTERVGASGTSPGQLQHPFDIAVDDGDGEIYVVDVVNQRIEVFASSGTFRRQIGVGELERPWSVALAQNKVYVSDLNSVNGGQIFVFAKTGGHSSQIIGRGMLKDPRDLAVDQGGAVYVTDQDVGKAYFIKFDAQGNKMFSESGPTNQPFELLEGLALDANGFPTPFVYLTDRSNRTVYRYNQSGSYLNHRLIRDLDPSYFSVEGVTVDWEGWVYVQMGGTLIAKLHGGLQRVGEIDLGSSGASAHLRAMNKNKTFYTVDYVNDTLRLFSPTDTDELWTRVPPGAKTGPIQVTTSQGSAKTGTFTVLDVSGTPSVTKVEVTQGLASYPFVEGKPTLVYAMINGLFGHPSDTGTVWIGPVGTIAIAQSFDRYEHDFANKRTIAYYHVPKASVRNPGPYRVSVLLARDTTTLYNQTQQFTLSGTKAQGILFVKLTNLPNNQWNQKEPFPWFNMKDFFKMMANFHRTFPLNPQEVIVRFSEGKYAPSLQNGVQDEKEASNLSYDGQIIFNKFYETGFPHSKVVTLVDFKLNHVQGLGGLAPRNKERALIFGVSGPRLVHELGHSYGLVDPNQSNSDGNNHSKNFNFQKEDGAPITLWNSLDDKLYLGGSGQVATIMNPGGGGGGGFFESKLQSKAVDYHILFGKFKNTSAAASASQSSPTLLQPLATSPKFVIVGTITDNGVIRIGESYLTSADLPLTPVEASAYSLVFLDGPGQLLSQDSFALSFETPDTGPLGQIVLDLVRPFPQGTARVEIRLDNQVLHTLIPSQNVPVVSAVTVQPQPPSLPIISWTANDPDGDPLTFALYFSSDGGATFSPITSGITNTMYVWDDRLTGGSANGLVKVEASDGFNVGSALSPGVVLPEKAPLVEILSPDDGATFTEGSLIRLMGAAFDPEDGLLHGENLGWVLDGEIDLGQGENVEVREVEHTVPDGSFLLPLDIGPHSIRLSAEDSDGNQVLTSITIQVVADGDGFNRVPPCPTNLAQFLAQGGWATDNCDTTLSYSCSDGPLVGGPCGGTITRTHTVTDDCNNSTSSQQIITVDDSIAPSITCPADLTFQCISDVPPCPAELTQFLAVGGSATDNCNTTLSYSCSDGPLVGGPCGGTIIRTHTVTDACGNTAPCSQLLTVVDTTPPMLTCPTNVTTDCEGFLDPSKIGMATASDNCDPSPEVDFTDNLVRVTSPRGIAIARTWTAIDACGNKTSCEQLISFSPLLKIEFLEASELQISWTGSGWTLLESSDLSGLYTPVSGNPTSPFRIQPSETKFFRLSCE